MSGNEIWKDVVGYEGWYQVSDRGNVRSVDRVNHIGSRYSGRILKPSLNTGGYLHVGLHKNGIKKTKLIHRSVAEAFIPNPENHPEVNHLDEVKENNNVSNLEWCTSEHNNNYGTRNERLGKKVRAVNIETGEIIRFKSTSEAGREGYNQSSVAKACRGDYKSGNRKLIGDGRTYKGYRWSYEEGDGEE